MADGEYSGLLGFGRCGLSTIDIDQIFPSEAYGIQLRYDCFLIQLDGISKIDIETICQKIRLFKQQGEVEELELRVGDVTFYLFGYDNVMNIGMKSDRRCLVKRTLVLSQINDILPAFETALEDAFGSSV